MTQLINPKILHVFHRNIHWILIILIQFLLILLCFSKLSDNDIEKLYYNVDCLYLPSLYTDIFIDGNLLKGWRLTPNPYFFPDMILYFIIYPFSQNVGITLMIFAFLQLLLIEFFVYKFIGLLIDDKIKVRQYFLLSVFFILFFRV